jgi:hypothetical protein
LKLNSRRSSWRVEATTPSCFPRFGNPRSWRKRPRGDPPPTTTIAMDYILRAVLRIEPAAGEIRSALTGTIPSALEGVRSALTETIQTTLSTVIQTALCSVPKISDENYEQSFAFRRLWFDIEQTYRQIPSDLVSNVVLGDRGVDSINVDRGELIHPTAHLILRSASDAESDHILAPYNAGLQSRLCARVLQEFFWDNLQSVQKVESSGWSCFPQAFYTNTNLIAHWANLGYAEEASIHDHILQSLISHPKLYDHQADALVILFKLVGATFEAYADPSAVDRCFELLKGHYSGDLVQKVPQHMHPGYLAKGNLVQVGVLAW